MATATVTAAAATVLALIGASAPAVAAGPSPSASVALPVGLYGTADPTYDGVWRQSLALLAQRTVGVWPARESVAWLAGQQCADGSFAAFRADPAKACDARTTVDTNSTGAAVQALAEIGGHEAQVDKSVAWLKSVQNADGGWGYSPGGATDANSTSVVIGALAQAGETVPNVRKNGRSPFDALTKLALPCTGEDAGAFAHQPDKKGALVANADATAAAVLGLGGESLAVTRQDDATSAPRCEQADEPERTAANGAAWLAKTLAEDGHLTSALPGAGDQPDYGNTADAVVALSCAHLNDQAAAPLRWLEAHSADWAAQAGPAAYAQLVLAASAARDGDVHDFGGQDLVALLNATGPAPESVDETRTATKTAEPGAAAQASSDGNDGGLNTVRTVGAGLLVGAIAGLVLIGRGRKRQQP
ncbi:prenyltransferase/squalene oxidase repeat-containing protein [Streptomyces sp. NBC_00582]|uniref:prenyltransferase/squalene oxidase repeat-containing protein n=1 Tax=Streptomyces sp. NBC_00582 TaxID=2975783 RepID=UPI002E80D139|nr:prenyltransferase/squalene oxidase repeat-containing protein [Streptomyces sp. NBC_00582]WUB68125.1 terpene cyclase/mutase family protein [Streptomyces sp. NBC_00582]